MSIKYNKGFSMIEILVALVILAIGLLGMATLMINSLQTSQSAAMRSVATLAAYDLIERMRSNSDEQVRKNTAYSTNGAKAASDPSFSAPSNCGEEVAPVELAKCDLGTWVTALETSLPGTQVVVKPINSDGEFRHWCIGIFWQDNGVKEVTSPNVCKDTAPPSNIKASWAFYEVEVLL